jgi:NAD-dependent SIR2 family protein deacetylase
LHSDPAQTSAAAALIAGADALLVCAGAGMGVDSGLPDFRGPEGFWRAYPPYRGLGLRFEEIADPVHFAADPELPGASTGTGWRCTGELCRMPGSASC